MGAAVDGRCASGGIRVAFPAYRVPFGARTPRRMMLIDHVSRVGWNATSAKWVWRKLLGRGGDPVVTLLLLLLLVLSVAGCRQNTRDASSPITLWTSNNPPEIETADWAVERFRESGGRAECAARARGPVFRGGDPRGGGRRHDARHLRQHVAGVGGAVRGGARAGGARHVGWLLTRGSRRAVPRRRLPR